MEEIIERPSFCKKKHLILLDRLRESGITNMFGAAPYLMADYPNLSRDEARKIVAYWMKTFSQRNTKGD